jgi:tetratricopeptide (TPR) repeat protein
VIDEEEFMDRAMLEAFLKRLAGYLALTYLVLDGHFGNRNALHIARQSNLHLISKLRCDAALYFPYVGPYAGRGPHRKYGSKLDYDNMPETYLKETGAPPAVYRLGYYPHNVHFLMISAQMAGVREDVIGAAERLAGITSDEVSEELAWVQAIKTAPFSAHAQFSYPDTILALASPGDRFPFVTGYWHYARGVAFALKGDVGAASTEAVAIEELITEADMSGLEEQYLPARDILAIAKHVVEARIAQARHDYVAAEQHLIEAIQLEDGISYMEPSYWYYPVRQTLGAVLLQQGRAEDAVAAFEGALAQMPRNGWALWGLAKAKAAAGDQELERRREPGEHGPRVGRLAVLVPQQAGVVVGAEQRLDPVPLAGGGEREPLLPGDALLALDHQGDAH